MQVRNLTIPIYPYLPLGSTFPWDSPYTSEDIATIERNSAALFFISMGSENGTRLIGPGFASADGTKVHQIPLENLVNREARVISIPKGEGEAITPEEIERAFNSADDLQRGDAILIATGWGDGQRWKSIGERYALESPYLTVDAAKKLVSLMERNGSDLLLTDCAYLGKIGSKFAREEWIHHPSWLRPPWPSDQAKAYLRRYTQEMIQADWAATLAVVNKVWAVAGLANCGGLGNHRVKLSLLPMFVQDAGEAPCTVVAELQD